MEVRAEIDFPEKFKRLFRRKRDLIALVVAILTRPSTIETSVVGKLVAVVLVVDREAVHDQLRQGQ
ncbi:hypothetical protein D3C76_1679140 [compost metagenome]